MSKNIIEIALKAGFINTSNGLESPFIEGEDLTDNLKLFASLLLAQPEQEPVTDKPTEAAMAVMPNGVCVSNVYDAYEEGRKSVMSEQDLEVLKKDWVNFGYTAGRKEGYNRGYAIAREDYKQKVINAFGVDDE